LGDRKGIRPVKSAAMAIPQNLLLEIGLSWSLKNKTVKQELSVAVVDDYYPTSRPEI